MVAISQLEREAAGVERSADLTARLERLLSLVVDAQMGGRGFIITGDDRFLKPFDAASVRIPGEIKVIAARITERGQLSRIESAMGLINRDIGLIRQSIQVRRVEGFASAQRIVASGEVKATTDSIRSVLGTMQAAERNILRSRELQTRATTRLTRRLIVLGGLAAILLALTSMFLINNAMKARDIVWRERANFFDLPLDLLGIASPEGYFREVNAAWGPTLGYSPAEVGAQPFIELVHPDDRAATVAEFEKLLGGVPTLRFQNRYRHKDGSYRNMLWTAMLAPDQSAVYASARDITQLHESQAEVERLSGMLPICAWCKNIRNDEGYWEKIEAYLRERSDAEFTHSICPDCEARLLATGEYRVPGTAA